MRVQTYVIGAVVAGVLLLLTAWWFGLGKKASSPPPLSPSPSGANNGPTSGNAPTPSNLPNANLPSAAPSPASSRIDPKAQAIEAIMAARNAQSQNFYGKVIDQYRQPVANAKAIGTLMQIRGIDIGEKKEVYTTQSDSEGNFEFTGLHGWQLGVVVQKDGYQMGSSAGAYKAPNAEDKTSSSARALFTMWKLKGAEPMIHARVHAYVPCNGTPTIFNLLTGREKGDLEVTLTRNPVNIDRGKPFDWTLTVGVANGGLIEVTDLYPNEAPADGYQPSISITVPAGDKNWTSTLSRSYYFKSDGGQTYGRMTINVTANFQPPPTFFGADIYANPSGSRNLEFDSARQINR